MRFKNMPKSYQKGYEEGYKALLDLVENCKMNDDCLRSLVKCNLSRIHPIGRNVRESWFNVGERRAFRDYLDGKIDLSRNNVVKEFCD